MRRPLPVLVLVLLAAAALPLTGPARAERGPFLPSRPPAAVPASATAPVNTPANTPIGAIPRTLFNTLAYPAAPLPAAAPPVAPPATLAASPAQQCRAAIAAAERAAGIPASLMAAIARVESGRPDPATGRLAPWPWTINAEGEPGIFQTKPQAIAAVRAKQTQGIASIDVGCMQVNLLHHPQAFASLDQAFDPAANAAYAARFLKDLHAQTGDWAAATARYHSATPERGAAYQRKVAAIWPEEIAAASGQPTPPAAPTGFLPPGRADNARVIPLASNGAIATPGRGLDMYRGTPVPVTSRPRG